MGYLERLRWPEGPRCQGCGGSELWRMSDRALRCADCRAETRLLAGSLFERSKLPLEIWFAAAWYLTNQKGGVSALGLQRARAGLLPDSVDAHPQASARDDRARASAA